MDHLLNISELQKIWKINQLAHVSWWYCVHNDASPCKEFSQSSTVLVLKGGMNWQD